MEKTYIKDLFKAPQAFGSKQVALEGWVRTVRDSKTFGFIELNDGSFFKNVQVVFNNNLNNFDEICKITIGSSILVEGNFILDGIACHVIDTAGIRETSDIVEKLGVNKSLEIIDNSDLVIFMLNNNEELSKEEIELLKKIKTKKHIIVINKIDLDNKMELNEENIIKISIKEKKGINTLKQRIIDLFNLGEITTKDLSYISNARSISLLKKSLNIINESINDLEDGTPIDIIETNLKDCWNTLGEIIGETYTDELIDEIFSRFCLGK